MTCRGLGSGEVESDISQLKPLGTPRGFSFTRALGVILDPVYLACVKVLLDKGPIMCYLCHTMIENTDPVMTNLTNLIEETRKEQKISIKRLAEVMNLKPRTYYRKRASKDGFNESEIYPAMALLRMRLVAVRNIDYVVISDSPFILDDGGPVADHKVTMVPLAKGWREKIKKNTVI